MAGESDLDIALVGPAYPYRGGIAHFIEKMHAGLAGLGCRVQTFTFTRQYPQLLFPGKSQLSTSPRRVAPAPLRCIDTLNPFSWRKASRLVDSRSPRIVVFKYWMPFFAPAFGTIARRVKKSGSSVLVVVDNVIPHERRPGDMALTRYFLSSVDGLVVMSKKVGDDLRTFDFDAPIRLVDHPTYDNFGPAIPVAEAREWLGLPPAAHVLLFFGFVRRYKGLHILLEAMPEIVRNDPQCHLVVAGEFYESEEGYRDQIRRLGIENRVTLISDYIPDDEVTRVFSAADVVVQPYVSATQSGVAQVAFNFDRPVITTNVGGLAETVEHGRTGLVVDPDSPEAIAEAVGKFFRERLAEHMSAAVALEKERFGWGRLYDTLFELAETAPSGCAGGG